MDFELRRAREKLEREQRERKQRAKLKLEREKKAREEALRQREAIEAAQSRRRLDAAEAEEKANQQMQDDLIVGRGVVFRRVLQAIPYQANGDKIKLPPSCFTELSDQGAFEKGPLHFSLSLAGGEHLSEMMDSGSQEQRVTHAGVLEFTSDEDNVGLPPHVWNNLFGANAPELPMVLVQYVWLPKGTYAKLQPDEFGFSDILNHKAVLETSLRQNATLTEGDVLKVHHGALVYNLRVLELKPSSSVSVLETDIEVDIIGSDSKAEQANHHVLRPLVFGKSEPGSVDEGSYIYYKFVLDDHTWNVISSGNANLEIRIQPESSDGGDSDLYVSRHPLLFPTRHQHVWSSHDVGAKLLILSSKDKNLGPGTYSIGIYGFKGETRYKVSVSIQEISTTDVGQQASSSSSSVDADTVECRNCKHYIPSRTIVLHEAFCRRHNILCQHAGCGVVLRLEEAKNHVHCEKCGKAFQQAEMDKHMKVFHEPLQCPCGVVLEKEQMVCKSSLALS
ncbi:OLC1v1024784C2 [Oldenlandia corymbosa var. corymbosa]|uniref:OLC1v1024784C2 n=1 Tax=Oldenlandia corymbosa var. corymbosa TaxID=529605 RepID=A0AAV1C363_OLDCO|nr:OLC1v1024784C2 [Oldenlandia corymbosa var. corymbosa]